MKQLTYSIHGHPDRDHIIAKKNICFLPGVGVKIKREDMAALTSLQGIIDLLIQSKLSRNIIISNIGKISPISDIIISDALISSIVVGIGRI